MQITLFLSYIEIQEAVLRLIFNRKERLYECLTTVAVDLQCNLFSPAMTCVLVCVQEVEVTLSNLVESQSFTQQSVTPSECPTVGMITVIIWPDHVDTKPVHMMVEH